MIDCSQCTATCCKSTYIKFGEVHPDTLLAILNNIKWFVTRSNIRAYIYDNEWGIEIIDSPCQFVDSNNRCSIYDNRPVICREYQVETCVKNTIHTKEKIVFDSIEQVDIHIRKCMSDMIKK